MNTTKRTIFSRFSRTTKGTALALLALAGLAGGGSLAASHPNYDGYYKPQCRYYATSDNNWHRLCQIHHVVSYNQHGQLKCRSCMGWN